MNIRLAGLEDLPSIVEIYNQAVTIGMRTGDLNPFSPAERLSWFEAHSPEKYPIFVATIQETVVGYLALNPYRPGRLAFEHTAEMSCYIHNSYHRCNIGSRLMEHTIQIAPTLGISILLCILLEGNVGSVKLLEKHGYQKWGCLPQVACFDGLRVNHLYYGLQLDGP